MASRQPLSEKVFFLALFGDGNDSENKGPVCQSANKDTEIALFNKETIQTVIEQEQRLETLQYILILQYIQYQIYQLISHRQRSLSYLSLMFLTQQAH